MNIAVIGAGGKLGSSLAACLARDGHRVIGVDVNEDTVDAINKGIAPVQEPGLDELMGRVHGLYDLEATTDHKYAVWDTDMAFVVVPTPSNPDGAFSNEFVSRALMQIAFALQGKAVLGKADEPYPVALVSTVMPGSCDELKSHFDGTNGNLLYTPAFIALGSVINNLCHPDMLLIGSDDPRSDATRMVAQVLAQLSGGIAPAHHMSLLDAEVCKLALNCLLSVKISAANEIAMLCESAGADAIKILRAIGSDSRIGPALLVPGGPPGGICLPRDLVAFDRYAESQGKNSFLPMAAAKVTKALIKHVTERLLDGEDVLTVGILGLSYKPNTAITTESIATHIISTLSVLFRDVTTIAHDPMVPLDALEVTRVDEAQELVDAADVVLIGTAWPEYAELDYGATKVLDLWGIANGENVRRFGVGR